MSGIKGKSGVYIRKNKLTPEQLKEHEREYCRKYNRKRNPEKYRSYARAQYRKNPEKYRIQAKIWRKNNIDKSKASQKRRYDKNPIYYRAQARERAKKNPDRVKNAWLLRYYKITFEDYKKLLEKQNGVCAICLGSNGSFSLSVDHNHKTGKVRGLLCSRCNFSLGNFNDNIKLLKKAIEYLERSKDEDRSNS